MFNLSFVKVLEQSQSKRLYMTDANEEEEPSEVSISAELPPITEFLLSAADLLSMQLSAKLVVVSRSPFDPLVWSYMFAL